MTTPLQALPRKQNSEDSALVPTSSVYLSGSPKPGARIPEARSAGKRDQSRALKARSGGAAQRVRQKATRERRRSNEGGRKAVERTCVGCGGTGSAAELLRVVVAQVGETAEASTAATLVVDLGGKLAGRGAWVHPVPSCIERACSRGFAKALAVAVRTTAGEMFEQIRGAAERRMAGLVLASARSRQLVYGRDAVKEVLGQAPLVILALDAQAVAKDGDLQRAGLAGKVVMWSTKAQLGHWLGRSEVGVVAITERSIAEVMRKTIALASLASVPRGSGAVGIGRSVDNAVVDGAGSTASQLECDAEAGSNASGSGASESSAVRDVELSEVR